MDERDNRDIPKSFYGDEWLLTGLEMMDRAWLRVEKKSQNIMKLQIKVYEVIT